jgi:hypothetical protein
MINRKIVYIFGYLFFISLMGSDKSYALDLQILQEQCADIGFKIKTPANGKCVLQLMQTAKNKEYQALAERKAVTTENAQRQQEASLRQQEAYLRQQQSEMLELQRRSIQAQENIAKEESRRESLKIMQKGLEMMGGQQPKKPTTCLNVGAGIISCN